MSTEYIITFPFQKQVRNRIVEYLVLELETRLHGHVEQIQTRSRPGPLQSETSCACHLHDLLPNFSAQDLDFAALLKRHYFESLDDR